MFTTGIDIGSRTTKVVILDDSRNIAGRGLKITGANPEVSATEALEEALLAARLKRDSLGKIASTGYGRRLLSDIDFQFTTVSCHAAGARHAFPNTRNVLNVGALRSAAIRLDDKGYVQRFRLNDQCGTGVGRYLERVAETVEIPLDEIGQLALFSKDPQPVPSNCSVLAESEVLSLITRNVKPADILRGVYDALASRLAALLKQVWFAELETTLTGGVAKNAGMVIALEEALAKKLNVGHDAEFAGAIGAAILAIETEKSNVSLGMAVSSNSV
jgi:(R)-2-hydroxyacyl-CoA dehydratese activating ATPase